VKKMRVLVATVGAAFALALIPAPAQAAHHCAPPPWEDDYGIDDAVWVTCEYGYHDPVGVTKYLLCWLSPTC
jgi:uncharacterized membrane protein